MLPTRGGRRQTRGNRLISGMPVCRLRRPCITPIFELGQIPVNPSTVGPARVNVGFIECVECGAVAADEYAHGWRYRVDEPRIATRDDDRPLTVAVMRARRPREAAGPHGCVNLVDWRYAERGSGATSFRRRTARGGSRSARTTSTANHSGSPSRSRTREQLSDERSNAATWSSLRSTLAGATSEACRCCG